MRQLLAVLVLLWYLALHKRPPGGGADAPSGKPDGPGSSPDTPSGRPSQQHGSVDAGAGITSAQDATGAIADQGTPPGGEGQTPGTADPQTPPPNQWDSATGLDDPPSLANINLTAMRLIHILDGDSDGVGGGHAPGTGIPGKSEFPERWDSSDPADPGLDDVVRAHVEDIARNPDHPPYQQDNGRWVARGTRDGVEIEVIIDPDGSIRTAYPISGNGVTRNDANGDPIP
ncbi:EndoU domain-containing protein [Actinokineospora diospyrosa]|uniref:EndoU nuclease n=1 Tax=Actinokineospora diospyrosa TaxID=103728 RepID=A0ABT1IG35_9PSEU|nr:EndoU domain-containing protein [Actinokineospora diospyrosa]MCP2271534.1 EndoU nuclease [Actinokineospora diospyrosa]